MTRRKVSDLVVVIGICCLSSFMIIALLFSIMPHTNIAKAAPLVTGTAPYVNFSATFVGSDIHLPGVSPSEGGVKYVRHAIGVDTNSPVGAKIYLKSASSETCLKHSTASAQTCANTSGGKKLLAGNPRNTINTWGYVVTDSGVDPSAGTEYSPVTASDVVIYERASLADDFAAHFSVASKVDYTQEAGLYGGMTLVFTVMANLPATPVITSVSPSSAKTGDTIIINGTNLATVYSIKIGSYVCEGGTVNDTGTQLSCTVPYINVASATNYGVSVTSWGGTYTYNYLTITPPTPTTMQAMTPSFCDSMTEGDIITLTDTRDAKNYRVYRGTNGCLMYDNLDYAGFGSVVTRPVSVSTSTGQYMETGNGKLYNWCGATAKTNCLSSQQNIGNGICPAPFRLPNVNPPSGLDEWPLGNFGFTGYYTSGQSALSYVGQIEGWWGMWGGTLTTWYFGFYYTRIIDPDPNLNLTRESNMMFVRCYLPKS